MITVIGLGFVGLTTALGFSEKGLKVYGYDINKEKTALIASGKIPFFEKGLDEVLTKNLNKNFLIASSIEEAVKNSKVIIMCVGTPSDDKGRADLTYIKSALDSILSSVDKQEFRLQRQEMK